MTEVIDRPALKLTAACWPVFEFLTNFVRQVQHDAAPAPDQVRYEALSALRDAEDLARNEPASERAWHDRVKAMLVYLLDYKMINTAWAGANYWFDNPFETDPAVLDHPQAIGGEEFFRDCDELQREYELAERRDRRDKHELAEQLGLYFVCLRLGFRGQYHDRPQELADYTRRLFTRLPAYASTRGKEMFPESYQNNQEYKINYNLGLSLSVVLVTFLVIMVVSVVAFRTAWGRAVGDIVNVAGQWETHVDAGGGTDDVQP
jgi:type IV/VI secretion system ImpK/VasF family protein